MLLNTNFDLAAAQLQPQTFNPAETYLDDVSRQISPNLMRRSSRGSTGSRVAGSMRIAKPSSTRNSPQNSNLNRRKTVMNDNSYRRRPAGEHLASVPGFFDAVHHQARVARPQSWHHPSYLVPQTLPFQSDASMPTLFNMNASFNPYELPPTPVAFSGFNSPSSTFSPVSQPFSTFEQEQYPFSENFSLVPAALDASNVYIPFQPSTLRFQAEPQNMSPVSDGVNPSAYSEFDWNNFAIHGFDRTHTAPATPENPLSTEHTNPSVEAEESIPYQALEELDDGEELVGMGLYDTPEKPVVSDPHLDNYRSLMMNQLLGSAYRKPEPVESTGKGLKLEETWNPPPSDDEKDDDDDAEGDEDAEGSVVDE